MKIKLKTQPIFGDNTINLQCPASWDSLSQQQLQYVFALLLTGFSREAVQTYMFVRFTGITIHVCRKDGWLCSVRKGLHRKFFFLRIWQACNWIESFNFVFDEICNNRLEKINGCCAVDRDFHDVPFIDFLTAESYYQAYLTDKSDIELIKNLGRILYLKNGEKKDKLDFSRVECLNVIMWYAYVKDLFGRIFCHLFRHADTNGDYNMLDAVNAQTRALTGGDITKEREVWKLDVWRALTELDAKAREADEFKRMKR